MHYEGKSIFVRHKTCHHNIILTWNMPTWCKHFVYTPSKTCYDHYAVKIKNKFILDSWWSTASTTFAVINHFKTLSFLCFQGKLCQQRNQEQKLHLNQLLFDTIFKNTIVKQLVALCSGVAKAFPDAPIRRAKMRKKVGNIWGKI